MSAPTATTNYFAAVCLVSHHHLCFRSSTTLVITVTGGSPEIMTMLRRSAGLDRCLSTWAFVVGNTPRTTGEEASETRCLLSRHHPVGSKSFLLHNTAEEPYLVADINLVLLMKWFCFYQTVFNFAINLLCFLRRKTAILRAGRVAVQRRAGAALPGGSRELQLNLLASHQQEVHASGWFGRCSRLGPQLSPARCEFILV